MCSGYFAQNFLEKYAYIAIILLPNFIYIDKLIFDKDAGIIYGGIVCGTQCVYRYTP